MDLLGISIGHQPSGVVLPLALRERLRLQGKTDSAPQLLPGKNSAAATASVTSAQLEDELSKLSQASLQVQKQIQRAEEVYFDETVYNVYKGWEGYMELREVPRPGTSQSRRMPADSRWFSSSCTNISSHLQSTPMGTKISALASPEQVEAAKKVAMLAAPMAKRVKVMQRRKGGDVDEPNKRIKADNSDKEKNDDDSEEEQSEGESQSSKKAKKKEEAPEKRQPKKRKADTGRTTPDVTPKPSRRPKRARK